MCNTLALMTTTAPDTMLTCRMPEDLAALATEVAAARGMTRSQLLRDAIAGIALDTQELDAEDRVAALLIRMETVMAEIALLMGRDPAA